MTVRPFGVNTQALGTDKVLALGMAVFTLCLSAQYTLAQTAPPGDPAPGFVACVRSSNCADSRGTGGLEPLRFHGSAAEGQALLLHTLATLPEARVDQDPGAAIRAVFTTALGFQDDVEFWIDPRGGSIDFRSRSRIGLYDLGKNRSRMTDFNARFTQQASASGKRAP